MKKYYVIQKQQPLPKSGIMFGSFLPLKDMEIGDRLLINKRDEKKVKLLIDNYGKKNGCAFMINYENEEDVYVYRTA